MADAAESKPLQVSAQLIPPRITVGGAHPSLVDVKLNPLTIQHGGIRPLAVLTSLGIKEITHAGIGPHQTTVTLGAAKITFGGAYPTPVQINLNPPVIKWGVDLDLTLQEIGTEDTILSIQPWMDNIRGGIREPGFGQTFEVPISGGIRPGVGVPIRGGIATPFIDPPVSPLAVHRGQGQVFLAWSHPTPTKVDYYELYAALNLSGPYTKYPTGEFRAAHGNINNLPLGTTIYFQLRAVGVNGAVSTFAQVKKGKFYSPLVPMKVRAIQGSKISNGAMFNSVDQETGMLVVIRAPAEILIN